MKNFLKAALLASALIFGACKKDKKDDVSTNEETVNESEGFYIKAKINTNQVNKIGGENCEISGDADSEPNGDGKHVNYYCRLTDNTFANFFEMGYRNVRYDDSNDADEMPSMFAKGFWGLDSPSKGYTITYHGTNNSVYMTKYTGVTVPITIDSIADLGTIKVEGKNKRAVKVFGTVDSVRLHEYDFDNSEFTDNFVDVTDYEFAVRFHSDSDL